MQAWAGGGNMPCVTACCPVRLLQKDCLLRGVHKGIQPAHRGGRLRASFHGKHEYPDGIVQAARFPSVPGIRNRAICLVIWFPSTTQSCSLCLSRQPEIGIRYFCQGKFAGRCIESPFLQDAPFSFTYLAHQNAVLPGYFPFIVADSQGNAKRFRPF